MASSPLLALAACCSALVSVCGASGSGSADSSADLKTDSYLGSALDPDYIFFWTPRSPGAVTEVFVEVQNAPEELPPAFAQLNYGPAECAAAVRNGFESWTKHSGVPMQLDLAFHDRGQTLDPALVRIEVAFRAGSNPGLTGYTRVFTVPLVPTLVERISVEIRIGPDVKHLSGEMVYQLLLHEFGHALGIVAPWPRTGHSNRGADVMFPTVRWSELSKNDRLALRELYSLEPTMRRADEAGGGSGGSGPGNPGSGDPGGGLGGWLRGLQRWGREIASEPARPAAPGAPAPEAPAAGLLRCASCER